MARVYHQREPLTNNEILILTDTNCRSYNSWGARADLESILHKKGQSNYYIYKCLCEHLGEITTDATAKFPAIELIGNVHALNGKSNTQLDDGRQENCSCPMSLWW